MRDGIGRRSAATRRATSLLLLTLLVLVAASVSGCGGGESPGVAGDDLGAEAASAIEAQLDTMDALGARLQELCARADAVQASIVKLAKANRADADAWKEEWAARQSAYAAAVAAVEHYNATVARPEMKAAIIDFFPEPGEPYLTEVVKQEAIPPKPLPAAPQAPAKLSVERQRILRELKGLTRAARALEHDLASTSLRQNSSDVSLAFVAVTGLQRLLVLENATSSLSIAVAELEHVLSDVRVALKEGVTSDPLMGEICAKTLTRLERSAAAAVEEARVSMVSAATANEMPPDDLPWASSTPL